MRHESSGAVMSDHDRRFAGERPRRDEPTTAPRRKWQITRMQSIPIMLGVLVVLGILIEFARELL